jgi:hypothetical protein
MASVPRHDTVVFLGPSLSHKRARDILDADFVPPVQAGDVHRLLATDVRRIVVIDGLFHGARSVWHRELIDALDEGIEVIGASSMGALRAAELCEDGMRGVGTVFEWYRSGAIDGDDEVALLHADGELGYRAMSEPLVNVRATLDDAVAAKEIDADEGARLLARARALPYAERAYPRLVQGEEEAQRARIAAALKARRRDLKAEDARAALKLCAASPTRPRGAIKTVDEETLWCETRHLRVGVIANGALEPAGKALDRLPANVEAEMRIEASARVFTLAVARALGVLPATRAEGTMSAEERKRQGLTPGIYGRLSAERAAFDALLATPRADATDLASLPGRTLFFDGLSFLAGSAAETAARARPWIAAWCTMTEVECPLAVEGRYLDAWSAMFGAIEGDRARRALAWRALCDWVVASGPERFGFRERLRVELLHDLQLRGEASRLVGSGP